MSTQRYFRLSKKWYVVLISLYSFNDVINVTSALCTSDVPTGEASTVLNVSTQRYFRLSKKKCLNVPKKRCFRLSKKRCLNVPKKRCFRLSKERCLNVSKKRCFKPSKERCLNVSKKRTSRQGPLSVWCINTFWARAFMHRVGQNHIFIRIYTVYIRYFGQGNHHTYGHIRCEYTVLGKGFHA